MVEKVRKNKNTRIVSEDISVDRKAVTKVIMTNIYNPNIIEINLSMFAIPIHQRTNEEYDEQIKSVIKTSKKVLQKYVLDNQELFDKKCILDINFTSANLKKGYNKSVQMSLFVRQRKSNKFTKIKKEIKGTIKDSVNLITSKIKEEDFKCFKTKQIINRNNK